MRIDWNGETLELHPNRGLLRAGCGDLLVADPHFGKDAAFRRTGIPLPSGSDPTGLERLDQMINDFKPRRLVFLGDFLHARDSRTQEVFQNLAVWRQNHPNLPILLVRGNHDLVSGDPPADLAFDCVREPHEALSANYLHHPSPFRAQGRFFAGHLHPGANLRDPSGRRHCLPCFWLTPRQVVLPAFGAMTGCSAISPSRGDRVVVIADGRLFDLPTGGGVGLAG